jgi:hypothetical protein
MIHAVNNSFCLIVSNATRYLICSFELILLEVCSDIDAVNFLTGAVERRRIGTASVDVAYTTILIVAEI